MRSKPILGSILIALGVIWSVGFPKTSPSLRSDFVMSVALALGLLGSGVLLFALRSRSWFLTALSVALLWSTLANVTLYAIAREQALLLLEQTNHSFSASHR